LSRPSAQVTAHRRNNNSAKPSRYPYRGFIAVSFPYHDKLWVETADFVLSHRRDEDNIISPEPFWWQLGRIYLYSATFNKPDLHYSWIIVHKGRVVELDNQFLEKTASRLKPVFANEVFVVLSDHMELPPLPAIDPHVAAYLASARRQINEYADRDTQRSAAENSCYQYGSRVTDEPIATWDPDIILSFSLMSISQLRDAMNQFFTRGGYEYPTLRDKALLEDVASNTLALLPSLSDKRVLDLGCGSGYAGSFIGECQSLIGVDISDVAVEQARAHNADKPEHTYMVMDAMYLGFADASFDVVLCVEAIEHVFDARQMFREVARVLKPGGVFVCNAANRNGLNQIITRALGFPTFLTNFQHIAEFTLEEIKEMLAEAELVYEDALGALLYPYWGVPGIDEHVRHLTDNNPEVVEATRELGRRAGPEYAYTFSFKATKDSL
jgi:SAM-dependent methyltransferase